MRHPTLLSALAVLFVTVATTGCSGLTRSEDFKIRKDPVVEPEPSPVAQAQGQPGANAAFALPGAAPGAAPARAPGTG